MDDYYAMSTRSRSLVLDRPLLAGHALVLIAPDDPRAIDEGRLFAGQRRILTKEQLLEVGAVLTWHMSRAAPVSGAEILIERRGGMVAASKPAPWSSEPDRTGSAFSLRERLSDLLGVRELHIATRLDVGVSGLVLAATDGTSRRHLARLTSTGECHRRYLGIAFGRHIEDRGHFRGAVETDKARESTTAFEVLARAVPGAGVALDRKGVEGELQLVSLRPETGHRHQLRIHCARAGAPLLGDRRYGGAQRWIDSDGRVIDFGRIFLHAYSARVPMPAGPCWCPHSPLPPEFDQLWQSLGGDGIDFEEGAPCQ